MKARVSRIVNNDGSSTESDKETANALNEFFFTSVSTHEPTGILPMFKDKLDADQSLLDIDISEKLVQQKLSKLKKDKSPGPDLDHPYI